MPYSWSETILAGTSVKASHVTELHTNINTERTRRGLAAGTFTQVPNVGDKALNVDMTDMRTALDQAHSANACVSYYATHDNGVLATHNVTYRVTHDSDHRSSHLSAVRTTHLTGYYNAVQTVNRNPHRISHNASYCSCNGK